MREFKPQTEPYEDLNELTSKCDFGVPAYFHGFDTADFFPRGGGFREGFSGIQNRPRNRTTARIEHEPQNYWNRNQLVSEKVGFTKTIMHNDASLFRVAGECRSESP